MPRFSPKSTERLLTCDPQLVQLFQRVVGLFNCSVVDGHRDEERQNDYYETGASPVRWPNSKHNSFPSEAVDVAPWPIVWEDTERFVLFAGFVLGIAAEMGIVLKWGGDWDGDTHVADERFRDLGHFELG